MLLTKDTFPALKILRLYKNNGIGDAGVASLALGLLRAPRTRLRELDLT